MDNIIALFDQAKNKNATELLISSSGKIKTKFGQNWSSEEDKSINHFEMQNLAESLLSTAALDHLKKDSFCKVETLFQGSRVEVEFSLVRNGLLAAFSWIKNDPMTLNQWNLSPIISEIVIRQGLNIILGPIKSGKTSLLSTLLQNLKNKNIVLFANHSVFTDLEIQSDIIQLKQDQLQIHQIPSWADAVVVDKPYFDDYNSLLKIAESGRTVFVTQNQNSCLRFLQSLSVSKANSDYDLLPRISEVLQLMIATKLVHGLDDQTKSALEILVNSSDMKKNIADSNIEKIHQTMAVVSDPQVMRTMNQSLLGLLVRRQIDMKTAFSNSPSAEEFDSLLKKIGI